MNQDKAAQHMKDIMYPTLTRMNHNIEIIMSYLFTDEFLEKNIEPVVLAVTDEDWDCGLSGGTAQELFAFYIPLLSVEVGINRIVKFLEKCEIEKST